CVTNPATQGCDHLNAQVLLDLGILASGQLQFVDRIRSSGLAVYDDNAITAIKLASPYPEVPDHMMALMKPGSTGLVISVRFNYVSPASIEDPAVAPTSAAKP